MSANIDNICNICTRMSVYPWFFVNKLRAGIVNGTLVPEAFCYSLLANFATRIASYIFFLLARSAESREKKASGRDRWEPHFHAISF